jgi:probable phosphoglycerate mutase
VADDDPRPPSTSLVLIRHGESVGNATRTITHWRTCSGLSDAGRAQCELLAKRLDHTEELHGAVLYASTVRRAVETAEFVAPVIGADIVLDERFAELDPGEDCDGLTYEEIVAQHAPTWPVDDPEQSYYPGGETWSALHARVGEALADAVANHPGERIAVSTHGGVIDAALRLALDLPLRGRFDLFTLNTSLTGLTRTASERWRLDRYNDTAHLLDGFW